MSEISLWKYQQDALGKSAQEFEKGINSQIINLPTGSGKTIIAAAISKQSNKKTLFLAHRDELITQAVKNFKRLIDENTAIGICKARQNDIGSRIVIGSVQTCTNDKRLEQLKKQNFEILLIDEAHHSVAATYKKIISALGFKNDKSKLLVGFTATPDRKGIGKIFRAYPKSK